jgi:hypothetical protein
MEEKMNRIFMVLFLTVFVIIGINAQEDIQIDDSCVHTIEQFINYLNEQNFNELINLFDWSVMEFNYIEFSTFMASIFPLSNNIDYPYLDEYNKITAKAKSIKEIETFISNLLLPEKYYNILEGKNYPWPISSPETFTREDVLEYLNYLDFARLRSLQITTIELVEPQLQFSRRNKQNVQFWGRIYGYTDSFQYGIYYMFEEDNYYGEITLCKYNNKWYISALSASLGEPLYSRLKKIN